MLTSTIAVASSAKAITATIQAALHFFKSARLALMKLLEAAYSAVLATSAKTARSYGVFGEKE